MEIKFECNHCGQQLAVEQAAAGTTFNCPTCARPLVVPLVDVVPPVTTPGESSLPPPIPNRPVAVPRKTRSLGRVIGITWAVVVAVLLVFLGMRAVLMPVLKKARERARTTLEHLGNGQVVAAPDGSSEVTVPSGWSTRTDLNPQAKLQVARPLTEEYLIVISENKNDYPDMTLERYSEIVRGGMATTLTSCEQKGPQEMQINGNRAIQYVVTGVCPARQGKIAVVYLHTCVEDSTRFHQILAWTLQSQFDSRRDNLQKIIATFKGRTAGEANQPTQSSESKSTPSLFSKVAQALTNSVHDADYCTIALAPKLQAELGFNRSDVVQRVQVLDWYTTIWKTMNYQVRAALQHANEVQHADPARTFLASALRDFGAAEPAKGPPRGPASNRPSLPED